MKRSLMSLFLAIFPLLIFAETIGVFFDRTIPQIKFAAGDIKTALEQKGIEVEFLPLISLSANYTKKKIVVAHVLDKGALDLLKAQGGTMPIGLGEQAYALRTTKKEQLSYWVVGGDSNGAMYGAFEIAENITVDGFAGNYNSQEKPFMLNRGIKLNLPLDARLRTYVSRWSVSSPIKSIPNVWDITFWKQLIDLQTRNRYNMLSIWNVHPFPALVQLPDYPKACLGRIEGFDGFVKELNHEQRVAFWREVMQYAHDRGMAFYFFNWNIHLEFAKDQYKQMEELPENPTTIDYMNKCMRALLETYPELDGFGISAGDRMKGSKEERPAWTWAAMGKTIHDYLKENPNRKFNFIHRGLGTNVEELMKVYSPFKSLPNVRMDYSAKYAMAHMYSLPAPRWGNEVENVAKMSMKTWLTVRNDDYFYINWGDPQFVRDFMAGIPEKDAVIGMYIGSDGNNPTRTFFYKDATMNGQLEVERRWYMEMLWGRIAYNPKISDHTFVRLLAKRYPKTNAETLFEAWRLASRALPKVTELIMDQWKLDVHWYPEGCTGLKSNGGFRTIDGFANETSVAKGSNLCDIAKTAAGKCENGKKSSYVFADEIQTDAEKALKLINTLSAGNSKDLNVALKNIQQMSYLSMYYAFKIRGATFKKAGLIDNAREQMGRAYCWWMSYTAAMREMYIADSFRDKGIAPDWRFADDAVLKEYSDLGGIGVPVCK